MVSQKDCVIQFQLKVQLNQIKVTQTNKYCFITFLGLFQYTVLSGLKPVLQHMFVIMFTQHVFMGNNFSLCQNYISS